MKTKGYPTLSLLRPVRRLLPGLPALAFLLTILGCLAPLRAEPKNDARPNILYILADDLGYGDLGCYGQETLATPHLDRLAAQGMRFTRHYAGNTVCAPSRSALLEGKHTGRTGVRGNLPYHLLDPNAATLGKALKAAGYDTAVIGKWGVGHPPPLDDPQRHGFDHHYGYINMWHAHNFYPEFLYRNGEKHILTGNVLDPRITFPRQPEGSGVAMEKVVFAPYELEREALDYLGRPRDKPFFLFFSMIQPHNNGEYGRIYGDGGYEVPTYGEYINRPWPRAEKGFASSMRMLDDTVGKPVVWIYTDMSDKTIPGKNHMGTVNDPDDISAMAGYLLLANEFDTRGIVVASTHRPEHATTPDQAAWADRFIGDAYRAEVANLNAHLGGGFPADIAFIQSSIKETAERYDPDQIYTSLDAYPTVRALLEEAEREPAGGLINVLCWGSLTEPAILVNHCLATGRTDLLKKLRFIAHWTNSPLHQGTPENPEHVANCREDAAACAYLKRMAVAGKIDYRECGAIGQNGIVGGAPRGADYYEAFKVSRLGRIFAEGKFVNGNVDHSDSATYWVLLGTMGVTLADIPADGTNTATREKANEDTFRAKARDLHEELLRRARAAAGR
jgi:hypothetical protein